MSHIKNIKETKGSLLIKISCLGLLTKQNTLRVDISLKNKVLNNFDIKTYIPEYVDISPFLVRILKLEEIKKGGSLFNNQSYDAIVAVGGGSVIDVAKKIIRGAKE